MSKKLLFLLVFLIPLVSFGQLDVKPNYTKPYFQGSVEVADTLSIDNLIQLKDGAIIKAENGGSTIDLRRSGNNGSIALLGDAAIYLQGGVFGASTTSYISANTVAMEFAMFNSTYTRTGSMSVKDNEFAAKTTSNIANFPTTFATQNATINLGLINSSIGSGLNVKAKTNNTTYANQFGFNAGAAFETILNHTTATQDNTISLPNTSGTISLLDIYSNDGTLTGNRTVTMGGFDLAFNGGFVGINTSTQLGSEKLNVLGAATVQGDLVSTFKIRANNSELSTQSAVALWGYNGHNLTNYGVAQGSSGYTNVNAASGQTIQFLIGNVQKHKMIGDKIQGNTGLGMKHSIYSNAGSGEYGFGIQSALLESIVANGTADFTWGHGLSGSLTRLMTLQGSGELGIGTTTPVASAILDLTSTTQGLLPPRMTTGQRDAIVSPAFGLIIYNVTEGKLQGLNGFGFWRNLHN